MTAEISHFSLRLYAFHLRNTGDKPATDAENIWQQCAAFGNDYDIADLKNISQKLPCYRDGEYSLEAEQSELLEEIMRSSNNSPRDVEAQLGNCALLAKQHSDRDRQLKFDISLKISQTEELSFDCFFYPILLRDTYCIILELKSKVALSLETLNHTLTSLRECIEYFQPSIGRTFLVSLQSTESNSALEKLAKICLQKLFNTNPINTNNNSQLLDSPIFSYDLPKLDSKTETGNKDASDRLLVWTINRDYSSKSLKVIFRAIHLLFCIYHKILYIQHIGNKRLNQAIEINESTRRIIQELKSLITNETLVSDLVEQKLDLCQQSVSSYQEIIEPIQNDFTSLEKQRLSYAIVLKYFKKNNFTQSNSGILYQLPANFDVNRYRIDDLWDKTQGWFTKKGSKQWVELHDLDLNFLNQLSEQEWNEGLNNFKHKLEDLFGFLFPAAWWSDPEAVKNIHQNLKHLCGDTACSSSVSNFAIQKRPITIAGAYLIALIAYVKVFKCTDLENKSLTQGIDWTKCGTHYFLAIQDHQTARASAKALYDFFCAVFRGDESQIGGAFFERNGATLRIQIWNAKGKFSKFSQSGLQIPDTAANTSQAILQLWRFMLPSEEGFLCPATIYMKDDRLILSSAEFDYQEQRNE